LFYFCFFSFIIFGILIPPLNKPDEVIHYIKAVAVSRGILTCSKEEVPVPSNTLSILNRKEVTRAIQNRGGKVDWHSYPKSPLDIDGYNKKALLKTTDVCAFPWVSYLPQAIAIRITTELRFNDILIFYSGRLAIYMCAVLGLFFISRILSNSPFKYAFYTAFLMPMSLQQLSAYNYDGIHIILGFLTSALFLKYYLAKKISIKNLLIFLASLGFFLISKGGYYAFALLIVPLVWKKYGKRGILYFCALIILFFIPFLFALKPLLYNLFFTNPVVQSQSTINAPLQLAYLKLFPSSIPLIISKTWEQKINEYVLNIIGNFGWLDTPLELHLLVIGGLLIGLGLFFLQTYKAPLDTKQSRIIIMLFLLIVIIEYLFLQFIFYLSWTSVGNLVVEGVQGRYFIVLLPLIFSIAIIFAHNKNVKFFILIFFVFAYFLSIGNQLFLRYYDSRLLINTPLDYSLTNYGGEFIPITHKEEVKIVLKENKKLRGIKFYLKNNFTYTPYIFELKKNSCTGKTLWVQSLELSNFSKGSFTVLVDPTSQKKISSVCISIQPLVGIFKYPLEILKKDTQIITQELYLL